MELDQREVSHEPAVEPTEALDRDDADRPRADAALAREAGGDVVSGKVAQALEVDGRREAGEDSCPLLGEPESA